MTRFLMRAVVMLVVLLAAHPAAAASLKAVQSGTTTNNGNGTVTVNITAVDPSKAFLIFNTRHNNATPGGSVIRGRIASSTTLEFVRSTNQSNTMHIQWYVVEYQSGVNVQRGSATQSSTTVNVGITPVAAMDQAFVTYSKTPRNSDSAFGNDDPVAVDLTSTSNVRIRAGSANSNHTIWWQVVEFTDAADINVQRGETSLTGSTSRRDISLSSDVDLDKTFLLASYCSSGSGSDISERLFTASLKDADEIRLEREATGDNIEVIYWQAVELQGVTVQHGVETANDSDPDEHITINAVDVNSSIAFASVQTGGGQSMGGTKYDGNDIIGVASGTYEFTSSNEINIVRSNTSEDSYHPWFVVDFGASVGTLFTDVSSALGVDVATTNDYHKGSGWHWGDLDSDGDLDAIVTGNSNAKRLMSQNQGASFSVSNFVNSDRDRGGALLDYDNDGDLDFFHIDEVFYENNGSGSFTNRGNLGFDEQNNNEPAGLLDFNRDGWIDVLSFSENGNWIGQNIYGSDFQGINDSGLGLNDSGDYGNGDYIATGDVNDDGYLDVYYNWGTGKLFLSDGDGTWTDNASGINNVTGNSDKTGPAFADYDNDGDLDLFVPRYDSGQRGYLWRNDGGSFTNQAVAAGITDTSVQRTAAWGDYDNDGYLDLYITIHSGDNILYKNDGDGTFTQVTGLGEDVSGKNQDAVFVDYDNDGDLDLSISREDSTLVVLRNNTNDNNYLKIRAIGAGDGATNRAAVGVRVDLYDAGNTTFIARRDIGLARGYAGMQPPWLHFGGVDPNTSYTIRVHFHTGVVTQQITPAATTTTIGSTTINQMLTVTEAAPAALFTDVSAATGFDVITATSSGGGSGFRWGDLDDDGDLDAIITGDQARQLTSSNAGASFFSSSLGSMKRQASLSDLDDDGDLDLWGVAISGYDTESMFENNGSGSLSNIGNRGFSEPENHEGHAAADIDLDGLIDLVMFGDNGNWVGDNTGGTPPSFAGSSASSLGLNDSGDYGNGDFASAADVNDDGYLDFFYHYNNGKLFKSDGDGTYTENASGISVTTGENDKFGSTWADYDNDGDMDLFTPRYEAGSRGKLWRNDGGGTFTDVTIAARVLDRSGQRSATWGDYDNDGHVDLYITTHSDKRNIMYRNLGDGTFKYVNVGVAAIGNAHDAVFVDYDNDGDLDLSIVQEDEDNVLLRNNTNGTAYLKVRLIGKGAGGTNKAAIGTRVELFESDGVTRIGRREIGTARGYGGAKPLWAHFGGLNPSGQYVIRVHWASGTVEQTVIPGNVSTTIGSTTIPRMLTIEEEAGFRVIQWAEVDPLD